MKPSTSILKNSALISTWLQETQSVFGVLDDILAYIHPTQYNSGIGYIKRLENPKPSEQDEQDGINMSGML